MSSLSFEPLIPAALWLALAVAGAALLLWYALRRPAGTTRGRWASAVSLMTLALALVLVVLLNPTWVREIPPPAGKPLLTVLVDSSGSMAVADAAGSDGKSTRFTAAIEQAAALTEELHGRFEVRVRSFDQVSATADLNDLSKRPPTGGATDLSVALAEALTEERIAGQAVVLLSDGIQTVGGAGQVLDAVRRARALAAPVYTSTLGSAVSGIDLALEVRSPQDLAFIGQRVPVTVQVGGRGFGAGARAQVMLLYDGKEIDRQEIELSGVGQREARFWIQQDKTGLYPYEARVEPVPGETTQANNSGTYLLRVIDEPVRVLLLEGKPYWDSKFLVRTLSAIPAVELESVVRISAARLLHRTVTGADAAPATAPAETKPPAAAVAAAAVGETARAESWAVIGDASKALADPQRLKQYQVIVLGRESEAFLTDEAVANLQAWVSRDGGSLVCARGSPTAQINDRLARMLPVKWTPSREARFRLRLTDQGREMNWLGDSSNENVRLASLPTLASSALVDTSKPLAVVLAISVEAEGAAGAPAVVYQPYGTGRVVVIEGAGMWRWAFLPPQYQQQDQVYGGLWHSMLRWISSGSGLLPGQKLSLRADKVSFATEESTSATLLVREESAAAQVPQVELLGSEAGAQPRTFTPVIFGDEPGAFRVDFGILPAGRYQARVIGGGPQDVAAKTVFDVKVVGREQMELDARPDLMARIAADSGGAELTAGDAASDVARQFNAHMARVRPPRYERTTAWDTPWVLIAVFAIWTCAWAVRRRSGLV